MDFITQIYKPYLSLSRPTFTQVGSKHGRVMYVWGARGQHSEFLILDWEHAEWRMARGLGAELAPGPRHAHTSTRYELEQREYIIVYGGYDDGLMPQNTAHIYSLDDSEWVDRFPGPSLLSVTPPSRSYHTATFVEEDNEPYLFVVGGLRLRDGATNIDRTYALSDLCILNLRTHQWGLPLPLTSRYHHSALLLPGDTPRILIMGGRDARGSWSSVPFVINVRIALLKAMLFGTNCLGVSSRTMDGGQWGNDHRLWSSFVLPMSLYPPLNGPLWLACSRDVVFVSGPGHVVDPDEPPLSVQDTDAAATHTGVVLLSLRFDMGWTTCIQHPFHFTSTHLPESTRNWWMWHGLVDSHLIFDPLDDDPALVSDETEKLIMVFSADSHQATGSTDLEIDKSEASYTAMLLPLARLLQRPDGAATGNDTQTHSVVPSLCSVESLMPQLCSPVEPSSAASYSRPPHADVTIMSSTASSPPLYAHALILSARSSFFRSLLHSGLAESTKREIQLDESYIVIYVLLHFFYTETLPSFLLKYSTVTRQSSWIQGPNEAAKLASSALVAASKYLAPSSLTLQLHSLIRKCINVENAIWVWRAAWLTSDSRSGIIDEPTIRFRSVSPDDNGEVSEWLLSTLRKEYVRQARTTSTPSGCFFEEISRWCRRRVNSLRDKVSNFDGARDLESVIEDDVLEAFLSKLDSSSLL